MLGYLTSWLTSSGIITFNEEPMSGWVVALEYAAYFWFHHWMHIEPYYSWGYKIHHRSTSPNLLTAVSVDPLASIINGGLVPLFTALFTLRHGPLEVRG